MERYKDGNLENLGSILEGLGDEREYELEATPVEDPCEIFLESLDSETLAVGERRVKEVWE